MDLAALKKDVVTVQKMLSRSKTRTRKNVRNSWYYSPYRNLVHEPNVPRQCTDAHTILKPAHVLEREPNP